MAGAFPTPNLAGTGYALDGRPVFERPFLRAMSFHAPEGLAAVQDATGAYHITPSGDPAYAARFLEAFGFYGGLATVRDAEGWFHVGRDGRAVHGQRFLWAGNFQEGLCSVQDARGFFHVRPDGTEAYPQRYAYVGDFVHGVAVAYEGSHARHIRPDGSGLHEGRYLAAGVFHKGAAVVQDERGQFHVGPDGRPVHGHRFRLAEPFYNGVALCTDHEGRRVRLFENGFYAHLPVVADAVRARELVEHVRRGGRAAVLLRHAEREQVRAGWGNELPLTARGERQARALGEALSGAGRLHVQSSPIGRCVQTAQGIAQGAGAPASIPHNTVLGSPGAFSDPRRTVSFQPETFGDMATGYIRAGRAAGMRPLEEGCADLLQAMEQASVHGLCVLVSHDLFVAGLARFLGLKLPTRHDWADYLEGVCILWQDGSPPAWRRFHGLAEVDAC